MPVEELQQATGVIIQMFPAMGVSMSSATAATAASSLAASVSGSISTYETATGVTGLVSTILGGVSFSTVGTIVLTAAAAAAIGAFIHWWVTHNNVVSDTPTSVYSENFIQIGNAKGLVFPGCTEYDWSSIPGLVKLEGGVHAIGASYLPEELTTRYGTLIYNELSTRNRWISSEDSGLQTYGYRGTYGWQYFVDGARELFLHTDDPATKPHYFPSENTYPYPYTFYIRKLSGVTNGYGVRLLKYFPGGDFYDSAGNFMATIGGGYFINDFILNEDGSGRVNSSTYSHQFSGVDDTLSGTQLDYISSEGVQIDAQLRPGGLYDFPTMQPGDIVTVTVPVIDGATNISDISQITSEVLDNISENVLDGNLSPETVPEPSIEYEPAPPIVAPVPVPVPEETPPPTFNPDDVNPPPAPPVVSGVSSTFIKMYNPTQDEVKTLASFMLSNSFVDNVLKLFSNPADYVIDISILPATVQTTTDKESVYIGNVPVPGLTMYRVTSQYTTVDFGTVSLTPAYGNFVDYRTKVQIFLPYIGERELNAADVIGADLSLTYNIDVMSGACAALLRVTNPNAPNPIDSVLYQWEGNLVTHIPISNSQWSTSLGQLATAVGSMFTGGVAGFAAAGTILATSTLSPRVSTKGNMTANSGLLGIQRPYIILEVPNVATPSNYTTYAGRSTSKVSKILDLSGFVKIEDIQLSGIPATSEELTELSELLLEGVHI